MRSLAVLCALSLACVGASMAGCQVETAPSDTGTGSPSSTATGTAPTATGSGTSKAPPPTSTSTVPDFDGGLPATCTPDPSGLYSFSAQNLAQTENVPLCRFRGKVLLIVNVASKCGNTPQYSDLEFLFEKHRQAGFYVLGFPCNQFGGQEPGDKVEITACTTKYGVSFPMFDKVVVNTDGTFGTEHPLYTFLKSAPGAGGAIEWNFAKFLVGKDGKVIKRYAASFLNADTATSTTQRDQLDSDIANALK